MPQAQVIRVDKLEKVLLAVGLAQSQIQSIIRVASPERLPWPVLRSDRGGTIDDAFK